MLEDKLLSLIARADALAEECHNLARELDPEIDVWKMPTTKYSAAESIKGAACEIAGGSSLLEYVWDELQKEKAK